MIKKNIPIILLAAWIIAFGIAIAIHARAAIMLAPLFLIILLVALLAQTIYGLKPTKTTTTKHKKK